MNVYNGSMGALEQIFGPTSLDNWVPLNVKLMDRLSDLYDKSYPVRTVITKLQDETVEGGVSVRYIGEKGEEITRAELKQQIIDIRNIKVEKGDKNKPKLEKIRSTITSTVAAAAADNDDDNNSKNTKKSTDKSQKSSSSSSSSLKDGKNRTNNKNKKAKKSKKRKREREQQQQQQQHIGHPWPWTQKDDMSEREQTRLINALKEAIKYGCLFGLVPVMLDPNYPSSILVPQVKEGRFIARLDSDGSLEVGWQRRSHGIGIETVDPNEDVHVFIWANAVPSIGDKFPFNTPLQSLLTDIYRERELVAGDTQATFELNVPPLILQENPRSDRSQDSQMIINHVIDETLNDPLGQGAGNGPGGTSSLTPSQKAFRRFDSGGLVREYRNRLAADQEFARHGFRWEIDDHTGDLVEVQRTQNWQRAAYLTPSGWMATSAFVKPTLRTDLLAHREDLNQKVANAYGVPSSIAFGDTVGSRFAKKARGLSTHVSGGSASSHMGVGLEDDACDKMRKTIAKTRKELSDFYAFAHYRLIWNSEAFALSRDVAWGEHNLENDSESTLAMKRQLELMGKSLRVAWYANERKKIRETNALLRASMVAKLASKHWKDQILEREIDALKGIVSGLREDSSEGGYLPAQSLHLMEKQGEGFTSMSTEVLRAPDDDGDITDLPREERERERKQRKLNPTPRAPLTHELEDEARIEQERIQWSKMDPNRYAEQISDKVRRTRQEGRHVSGYTTMLVNPQSVDKTYQRRALTEELPSFTDALSKAEKIVSERIKAMKRLERKKKMLHPVSGDKGDGKVKLIWRIPPKPNWTSFGQATLDGIMNAKFFQYMYLLHMGFDPSKMTGVIADTDPFGINSPRLMAVRSLKDDANKAKEKQREQDRVEKEKIRQKERKEKEAQRQKELKEKEKQRQKERKEKQQEGAVEEDVNKKRKAEDETKEQESSVKGKKNKKKERPRKKQRQK